MIIDCHNHPDWHGHNLDKFLANTAKFNIDVTWLLSWESPENDHNPHFNYSVPGAGDVHGPIPFTRCVSYAERAPGKFVIGYAPDPRQPDAVDKLQAAMDIYGARICGELKYRMMYDNPDALRLYRFCAERKAPVTVHIDYPFDTGAKYPRPDWWYGGGIEAFERALRACPETVFLGHAAGFWSHISGDGQSDKIRYPKGPIVPGGKLVEILRKYPNLYCDTSASGIIALTRDPEFAKDFLLEFQDRILYGRDYFDNAHQEFLNALRLPAEVLAKIYSGNAQKLVPI